MAEVISTKTPFIFYQNLTIVTEKWPKKTCDCHGTGVYGVRRNKVQPKDTTQPNGPCPCGSGKKYKKCCRSIVDHVRSVNDGTVLVCKCVGKCYQLESPKTSALNDAEKVRNELKKEQAPIVPSIIDALSDPGQSNS